MNLRLLLCAASLAALTYLQPLRPYVVDGTSMSPTLASGQWIVGDVRPRKVARGDVVVFRHGSDTMVKRVAYLPGDRIERYLLQDQWLVPLNERMRSSMIHRGLPRRDLVVPEACLFVVGDNYQESVDSRTYGPIDNEDVLAVLPKVAPRVDGWWSPGHLGQALVATL